MSMQAKILIGTSLVFISNIMIHPEHFVLQKLDKYITLGTHANSSTKLS